MQILFVTYTLNEKSMTLHQIEDYLPCSSVDFQRTKSIRGFYLNIISYGVVSTQRAKLVFIANATGRKHSVQLVV